MHELPTTQRTTYLRGLLQSHGRLSLPLGSGLSFSLLQIFQPLRLRQSATDKKKSPQSQDKEILHDARKESEDDKETLDVFAESGIEALNKSPRGRIVILGSPGTGKTTVLKHLLYQQAQSALENSEVPLPIFLSLPDLAQMEQDLETYLAHIASAMGLDADYGRSLFDAIQHGNAFVCLDSLDEVLPRLRAGIIRQINELAQDSGNTWIVGSRFTDYKGGQFQQGEFLEWDLQPLDHERRLQLAAHLLPELQRQMSTSEPDRHLPDPHIYVQQLSEHRQAATWGTNPLLFSLGAVVYLRRGSLSGSRAMLYREVIAALLETRGGDSQLYQILAHSALELYQIKGRTFTADDLQAALINLNVTQQATWNVSEMQYRVLNSGLLDVVVAETYSFRHQTFQEYLVASALAGRFMSPDEQIRETAYQLAWSKHTYSRWNEVERLLVGILVQDYGEPGMQQAQVWLTRLLQQRHSIDGDPGHLSLELAVKALGEVAQLEEWQAAETLTLEELTSTAWGEEVKNAIERAPIRQVSRIANRYRITTADISHLHPTAQLKTIEPLLLESDRNSSFHEILGAIHSPFMIHYLLEALTRAPNTKYQWSIRKIFAQMGEYAPIDFLLDELSSQDNDNIVHQAEHTLIQLATYVPAEKLIPILQLEDPGRSNVAAHILLKIAAIKELPIAELLNVLHDSQKDASFHAAHILASIHHPAAIDPLLAHLNDAQYSTRLTALYMLGQYPTLNYLDKIIPLLEDNDDDVRRSAVEVLARFGSAIHFDRFVQAASDPDPGVRSQAIEALSQFGDQAPLDVLIQATNDPSSRNAAIHALVALIDRVPLELLLNFLRKPDFVHPMLEALSEKGMLGRIPVQLLLDVYAQNWQHGYEILSILCDMDELLASPYLLNHISTIPSSRLAIIWLLEQPATSTLIAERVKILGDRCYPAYTRAIAILGNWQGQHAIDALMKALADERWRVSDAAARALRTRADECSQEDLLALLAHRHAWVRRNALQILTECSTLTAIEPLVATLHDGNNQVREIAARALRRYGDIAPLEALLTATLDDNIEVCRAAAVTLSKIGQRNPTLAVTGVINLLRHEKSTREYEEQDERGYSQVWQAFEELSSFAPAKLLLQAMYDVSEIDSRCVANALGQMGDRAPIAQLTQALQDQNPNIQRAAIFALSMAGPRAPVAELIKVFDASNSNKPTQQVVIEALTKVSVHGHVPDEIFLQKIFKKHDYDTYPPLFEAFTAQGKRIPDEIVLDALEHDPFPYNLSDLTPVVVPYLSQFTELLPVFPEKLVVEMLMSYYEVCRYQKEPDAAEVITRLLPKLSVNSLMETITPQYQDIRMGGLALLSMYPGAIPLEPILANLHDPNDEIRSEAIKCLQKRPERLPVQAIIACLQDNSHRVRKDAITALVSLGAQAPHSELLAMLDTPAYDIQSAVMLALAQPGLCERVPLEIFVNALGDHYKDERQANFGDEQIAALKVLQIKDLRLAIEHCIAALGGSSDKLALFAFQLLEQIHPEIIQEAQSLFQDGKPGRFFRSLSMSFVADVLGDIGQAEPSLITQLSELLDWPYWEVRMKAVRALGQMRRNIPDATIRRLLDLRHDPQSRAVREAADEALAEILSLETGIEDD